MGWSQKYGIAGIVLGLVSLFLLSSCTSSIEDVGSIGPKKLHVYAVAHNDFLSANRMLVVLNDKGDVTAYSGGTVSGFGTVGLQTTASLIGSAAIVYGAKAVEQGLQNTNANVNVRGIPSKVDVNANANLNAGVKVSGEIIQH